MKNGTFLDFTTVVESNVIIFKYISCRHVMTVAEVFYVKWFWCNKECLKIGYKNWLLPNVITL